MLVLILFMQIKLCSDTIFDIYGNFPALGCFISLLIVCDLSFI